MQLLEERNLLISELLNIGLLSHLPNADAKKTGL